MPLRAEVQINIVLEPDLLIGPEVIGLLAAIVDNGSITAAAKASGISYKKAWYMVERLNRAFGKPLVGTSKGGGGHGGAALTDMGVEVVRLYREISAGAEERSGELRELAALLA